MSKQTGIGWGIVRQEPPNRNNIERTTEEKINQLVKQVKWEEKTLKEKAEKVKLLFNGDGKLTRTKRARGRDDQAEGTRTNK